MPKTTLTRPVDGETASLLLDPDTHLCWDLSTADTRCLAAAIGIIIGTGARLDEMEALEINDLERSGCPPTIRLGTRTLSTERCRPRDVPLLPAILEPLDAYLARRPATDEAERRLFLWASGSPVSGADIRRVMRRFDRSRRLSRDSPEKSLRLTFRQALFEANAPDDLMNHLMGIGGGLRIVADQATLRARHPEAVFKLLDRFHVLGRLYVSPAERIVLPR